MVLGRAIVRDLYGPKQAASMIGYVTMGMAVMPTVAPAIGGLLDRFYGWQGGFALFDRVAGAGAGTAGAEQEEKQGFSHAGCLHISTKITNSPGSLPGKGVTSRLSSRTGRRLPL